MRRRTSFDTRPLLLALSLGVLVATGCGRPPASLRGQDAGVDAVVDAAPDAAAPLRRLTSKRLFGDLPVENGVVDPTFSSIDYQNWSAYNYMTGQNALVTPLHLPTPTGLPALRVIVTGNQASLTGLVRSSAGPVEVSLWCGRPVGSAEASPRLSLLGLYPAGQGAADFEPDPQTPGVTLGEITWTRHAAELATGPMGWSTLRVVHQSEDPLYLNAPALLSIGPLARKARAAFKTREAGKVRAVGKTREAGKARAAGTRRITSVRPLTPEEREHLERFFAGFRDRFGGPPRR